MLDGSLDQYVIKQYATLVNFHLLFAWTVLYYNVQNYEELKIKDCSF